MQKDLFGGLIPVPKRRKHRTPPPILDNGWAPPTSFPRLSDAKVISLDVETKDPSLIEKGPGWARNDGHIVGVAIGADHDGRWYFPMRHETGVSQNLDPKKVLSWLRTSLATKQPKIGANLIYDIGWLDHEGVTVNGDLYDVQYAEALLSETGKVALDNLAVKYLNEHKVSDTLYRWCAETYGGNPTGKQRANIYKTPPKLVGPYAESDIDLPLRVLPLQAAQLNKENLFALFKRENQLIRLLIAMRKRGVSIDVDRAEQLYKKMSAEIKRQQKILNDTAGIPVDIYAPRSLGEVFDSLGLSYGLTAKSQQPSFTKEFLNNCKHPFAKKIVQLKELDKLANVFIKAYLLENNIDGKIYCQFHPLRTSDYGTRSGRFSSSTPNLQNIPSKTKLGRLIRSLFIPGHGYKQWIKQDASQIEYRFLAHFAKGEGAASIRRAYQDNPNTDYHTFTQQLIKELTGLELDRKSTKNINFGFIYGMGKKRLAHNLGLSATRAEELFTAYHRAVPFARATMDHYKELAELDGFVTTITGRRSRFELYEPAEFMSAEERVPALPRGAALREYGPNIKRAQTHKSLNRKIQGSAADLLKEGMLQCWEQGVFDYTGVPVLTVHDELDWPDPGGARKYFEEVVRICESAIPLRVPVIVEEETGPNWGEVKKAA